MLNQLKIRVFLLVLAGALAGCSVPGGPSVAWGPEYDRNYPEARQVSPEPYEVHPEQGLVKLLKDPSNTGLVMRVFAREQGRIQPPMYYDVLNPAGEVIAVDGYLDSRGNTKIDFQGYEYVTMAINPGFMRWVGRQNAEKPVAFMGKICPGRPPKFGNMAVAMNRLWWNHGHMTIGHKFPC